MRKSKIRKGRKKMKGEEEEVEQRVMEEVVHFMDSLEFLL